jgi:hypothetical protein
MNEQNQPPTAKEHLEAMLGLSKPVVPTAVFVAAVLGLGLLMMRGRR